MRPPDRRLIQLAAASTAAGALVGCTHSPMTASVAGPPRGPAVVSYRPGEDAATVRFLGAGREAVTFTLEQPAGVILLYRLAAPAGMRVRADVRIPSVTVPLAIANHPNVSNLACEPSQSDVVCTAGEEWCPMPKATWQVRVEKLRGPPGAATLSLVVGPPPGGARAASS